MAPIFRISRGWRILLIAAVVLGSLCGWSRSSDAQSASEYELKAAFLYKFVGFVNWPEPLQSASPVRLCVIGDDPFGPTLDRIVSGQTIGERPMVVERFAVALRGIGCHVAYLSGSRGQTVREAIAVLKSQPVLIVTDESRAPADKGIIHFLVRQNRLRFEIDDLQAAENNLTLSSKLLSLATTVKARP
jgi:hypothetical protein